MVDVDRFLQHSAGPVMDRYTLCRWWQVTQGIPQRGGHLVSGLGQRGAALQPGNLALAGSQRRPRNCQPEGAGVPHRLSHRESAGGGQRLRLADAVRLLRHPGRVAAPCAAVRGTGCHSDARRHGVRGQLAHRAVPLDPLSVWRLPAADRGQDAVGRRQGA